VCAIDAVFCLEIRETQKRVVHHVSFEVLKGNDLNYQGPIKALGHHACQGPGLCLLCKSCTNAYNSAMYS